MSLAIGSTIFMTIPAVKMSGIHLDYFLIRHQITVLQATPTLIRLLPSTSLILGDESCLRVLALGGEACPTLKELYRMKSVKVS